MNVRKFVAANARDALRKVKETLGPDAIILSNRGVAGGVEIMAVAAREMAMLVPTPSRNEPPVVRPAPPPLGRPAAPTTVEDEDYSVSLSRARAAASRSETPLRQESAGRVESVPRMTSAPKVEASLRPEHGRPAAPAAVARPTPAAAITPTVNAAIPKNGGLRNLDLPSRAIARPDALDVPRPAAAPARAEAQVIPVEMMDEIRALRRIVEQHLAGFAWGETARREPVKTEILRQMLEAGFSPQFARELLTDLPTELDVGQAMAWAKGAADRSLLTINSDADIIDQGGVYALVGPTGVGKTTTTAKLAARSVLRHGPGKVALVTTDSYRIGAHEQLRIYGRILGISVYLVKDAAELRQTLHELQHKHIVLIDTMGMSQKDKLVAELTDMLAACRVQRLLLLSSTSRGDTLDDVVRAYLGESLAGCILTKVDEAASLAATLDVIMRHGLRLHYVCNGQRVPEDLHLPNRTYLVHRAFKDAPTASPHRLEGVESTLVMANAGAVAMGGLRG